VDLFQVDQPFAVAADDIDGLLYVFIAVGIGKMAQGVVYLIDAFDNDAGFFEIDFIGVGKLVVIGFPFVEDHLVGFDGIFIEVKHGPVVIAVEGGADEFAAGFFGAVGFLGRGFDMAGSEEGAEGERQD